jgi:hypothetical protein
MQRQPLSPAMDFAQLAEVISTRLCAGFGFSVADVNELWTSPEEYTTVNRFLNVQTHCLVCFEGRLPSE